MTIIKCAREEKNEFKRILWNFDSVYRHISRCGLCLFYEKDLNQWVQRCLTGFAAGVMVAASVWSLLIPALEQSEGMGKLSFVPAAVGFWAGVLFLLLLDHIIPHLHQQTDKAEGPKSRLQKRLCLYWQLHFIISRKEWQSVSFMLVI